MYYIDALNINFVVKKLKSMANRGELNPNDSPSVYEHAP